MTVKGETTVLVSAKLAIRQNFSLNEIINDKALALHLLDHGVAIVAASGFGGKDGFRISFAADEAKLEEALRRIAAAVA